MLCNVIFSRLPMRGERYEEVRLRALLKDQQNELESRATQTILSIQHGGVCQRADCLRVSLYFAQICAESVFRDTHFVKSLLRAISGNLDEMVLKALLTAKGWVMPSVKGWLEKREEGVLSRFWVLPRYGELFELPGGEFTHLT